MCLVFCLPGLPLASTASDGFVLRDGRIDVSFISFLVSGGELKKMSDGEEWAKTPHP
jgi:hypothetical protein